MASYANFENPLKKYKNGVNNLKIKPKNYNKANENMSKNAKVQGWHDKQKSIKNASTRLRMTWRVII